MRKAHFLPVIMLAVVAIGLWWLRPEDQQTGEAPQPAYRPPADLIERGRELVTLADCRACHTVRGGAPFAGGHGIPTPFGTFYSPNITPDTNTGIGRWSAADFWHALHNGYAKDGTLLYPTFPYTNYTKLSRRDADAMFAYLHSVAPVSQPNRPHELKFPYNHRLLLIGWRYLFFRPGVYQAAAARSPEWNRGAYLIQGPGHCSACHEARNAVGAIRSAQNPSGGLVLSWYAPTLLNSREAGVQNWSAADIVQLLKTGQVGTTASSTIAAAMGPMGQAVHDSLQYVHEEELQAMAVYLQGLPDSAPRASGESLQQQQDTTVAELGAGEKLYTHHCAQCHGDHGEGRLPAAPPLAGNRGVTMSPAANPIRIVLFGGYPPGTAGNPRPFGMPPYVTTLTDTQIADVLTYVRASWGNTSSAVYADEVAANRGSPLW